MSSLIHHLMRRTEGENNDYESATTGSFVSALVTGLITIGVCLLFWLVFHGRKSLYKVFQPRAALASPDEKPPTDLPANPISWWKRVFSLDDTEVLDLNGPDAYFFVRFLKIFGLYLLAPYLVLTFGACIPVSAIKPNNNQQGLNQLAFGNVPADQQLRHLAHFIVAVILMIWTMFVIWREYHHYMEVRMGWFRANRGTLSSRTVEIVNVPEEMMSESGIRELASSVASVAPSPPRFSGATDGTAVGSRITSGVTHVWLARKVKEVNKVYEDRDKEVNRLESGVAKLLKTAAKNQRKGKTPEAKGTLVADREGASILDRYVLPKKQPTWKQGLLGLIGKKMDLHSSPVFIREHNEDLAKLRDNIDNYKLGNVAWARFNTQEEAHNFARLAKSTNKKQLRTLQCGIELVPDDVVWSNTDINGYQRKGRSMVSWGLTISLIIFWTFPVAFFTSISNVDTLCGFAPFSWICKLPDVALGIIKGVLPGALMALLFMLLPRVLRIWIKLQGETRKSEIELKLFTRYWLFWVVQGFLVATVAAGLMSALGNFDTFIKDAPTMLAEKLPGASIYFLTFILTATWAGAAKSFARIVPVVMYQFRNILAGKTPRAVFTKKYALPSFLWSETAPNMCLVLCIAIVYSVIQPVAVAVCMVAMFLTYAGYKYLLVWTADQPRHLETGGRYYIKCMRTVFVALYIEQIFLSALFFLMTDASGKRSTVGLACGAIMAALCGLTAVFQAYIDHVYYKKETLLYGVRKGVPVITSSTGLNTMNSKTETLPAHGEDGANEAIDRLLDHPALWKKQPCVWIANDTLGLGNYEADQINAAGVEASTQYATMNEKGVTEVERSPPDEDWDGGVHA